MREFKKPMDFYINDYGWIARQKMLSATMVVRDQSQLKYAYITIQGNRFMEFQRSSALTWSFI